MLLSYQALFQQNTPEHLIKPARGISSPWCFHIREPIQWRSFSKCSLSAKASGYHSPMNDFAQRGCCFREPQGPAEEASSCSLHNWLQKISGFKDTTLHLTQRPRFCAAPGFQWVPQKPARLAGKWLQLPDSQGRAAFP